MRTRMSGHNSRRAHRTPVLVILCLMALLLLIVGSLGLGTLSKAPPTALPRQVTAQTPPCGFPYFKSGQWLADARTLVAIAKYVCSAEAAEVTNRARPLFEVAMPTNCAPVPNA